MSTAVLPTPAVDPWTTRPIVGKFRVLSGVHSEGAVPGTYRIDPVGAPMSQPRIYTHGEIVASRSDLLKHNPIHGEKKFERVDDSVPDKYDGQETAMNESPQVAEDLELLTIPQLRHMAAAEGIDLGDFTRKSEIIDWIRTSRGGE